MKAYDTRMEYERTIYITTCRRCGAEIEGELKEFKPVSRFTYTYHCPACNAHNTVSAFKLHPLRVIENRREIEKLEV